MPNVMLGIIGNGRRELLDQTIASLEDMIEYPFFDRLIIDDTGNMDYQKTLITEYGQRYRLALHRQNLGLSGSIRTLWGQAYRAEADYIFHVEEDFTFNEKIDIGKMVDLLDSHSAMAQVALVRQPVNGDEAAAGGMLNFHYPDAEELTYQTYDDWAPQIGVAQNKLFTLNPSLYPRWVYEIGWEQGWGEREFSDRLFQNPMIGCTYLGKRSDPPKVHHIGNYRAEGWKL